MEAGGDHTIFSPEKLELAEGSVVLHLSRVDLFCSQLPKLGSKCFGNLSPPTENVSNYQYLSNIHQ
jgi:hypothetical protein